MNYIMDIRYIHSHTKCLCCAKNVKWIYAFFSLKLFVNIISQISIKTCMIKTYFIYTFVQYTSRRRS